MNSISPNLNIMIKAVEEARVRTARDFHELEILQTNQATAKKYANSCFLRVKNFIFDDLSKMRPEYNISSSDGDQVINSQEAEYYFFIHPIDGLTNLSRSISEFSIAISLIYKGEQKDETVACVIHKVIGGELFYTEKGFDCFINNRKIRCANSAKENFINVFSNKAIPNDIPEITIESTDPIHLLSFLNDQKLAPSKKEGRRLIDQGAVSINDEKITDPNHEFSPTETTILKVGKRKFLKIN